MFCSTESRGSTSLTPPDFLDLAKRLRVYRPNMKNQLLAGAFMVAFTALPSTINGAPTRPAMVGNGGESFAAQLHYPPKAKASRTQAAVPFYCEIGPDGKPSHIHTIDYKGKRQFTDAVDHALRGGRFQPAMVDGKPVPVMIGGTVIFMFTGNTPAVVVSLSTADKEKTAKLGNYIQPQLIGSDAEFRRKIFKSRFDIHFLPGEHPSAEVLAHVDAQGNLTGTTLTAEAPPKGGYGANLVKAFQGAKFIPAMNNGSPTAGDFNMPVDFKYMKNPDDATEIGSQLKDDR